jgi:carboxypeptidase Taq
MAAQLFEVGCGASSQVRAALEEGDVGPLSSWLRENVWRHGRRFGRDEILGQTTGRALDLAPYVRHLGQRYIA